MHKYFNFSEEPLDAWQLTDPNRLLKAAEEALEWRRVDEALVYYDQAEAAGADADQCAAGRWTCHMLRGEYAAAWHESDLIEQRGNPDPNRFWNGRPVDGKRLLVRCLHGLGDTLQFIRFAPEIRRRAKNLTLEVQPALKRLVEHACASGSELADQVITWGEAEPEWEMQTEINELPRMLRVTLNADETGYPCQMSPYLHLAKPGATQNGSNGVLRVGLTWAAGDFDCTRSVPPELFDSLIENNAVEWVSLQAGEEHADAQRWPKVIPFCGRSTCILEVAKRMMELDLIITVDTMNAHLAGALGRPTWTLLPFASDWRWMLTREDSPWYPGMRLFRQSTRGDWNGVIERVQRELGPFSQQREHLQAGRQFGKRGLEPIAEA